MATEATGAAEQDLAGEDARARRRAVRSDASLLVRAPAGSGKTELLIQRFLRLLATVEQPEAVAALTFSRKAAAEMRARLLRALEAAAGPAPEKPHELATWELATAARRQDAERGWNLLTTPSRLRVMTLDALALELVGRMPWLSRFGAAPRPTEAAEEMYAAAAHAALSRIEDDDARAGAARRLVGHLHADLDQAERMLAALLGRRDQWLALIAPRDADGSWDRVREAAEREVRTAVEAELAAIAAILRREGRLTPPASAEVRDWREFAQLVLTATGGPRKTGPCPTLDAASCAALHRVRALPDSGFTGEEWELMEALFTMLPLAVAELRLLFAARGECDFTEVTFAARQALGGAEAPSGLAFALDTRLRHLFVDEFQDTSRAQFDLICALIRDWESGDGRTLFLVGDPLQSIYGWRNAELGLLLRASEQRRIGRLELEPLRLSANYRSQPSVVDWCNRHFGAVCAEADDLAAEAVGFSPGWAMPAANPDDGAGVEIHGLGSLSPHVEAERVADIVAAELAAAGAHGEIAILAQGRGKLAAILPALRRRGIRYEGVKLHKLGDSAAVADLLALTRALHDPADRMAWLGVLRAPWCGLGLADLHALCLGAPHAAVLELMQDAERRARVSEDGQDRLGRVVPVLTAAALQRGRTQARPLVEWCWQQLGGAACTDDSERTAVEACWQMLEEWDGSGARSDGQQLAAAIQDRFVPPDAAPPTNTARVRVMTAHNAKGLEFDTVILPGLGRTPRQEEAALLRWIEQPGEAEESRWWMAPKPAKGSDDLLYKFVGTRQEQRREQEQLRLLYVAATRARRRLHLVAAIPQKNGDFRLPAERSPLARLWPAVEAEFRRQWEAQQSERLAEATAVSRQMEAAAAPAPRLRRVIRGWSPAPAPAEVSWGDGSARPSAAEAAQEERPLAGGMLRQVGKAVHALLQRMAVRGELQWEPERLRAELRRAGVVPDQMEPAMARSARALEATRRDARGRWILAQHPEAQCEWALAGTVDGVVERRVVDRSFIDADGARWIIDYKIADHAEAGRETFLDQQMEAYRPQLNRYAALAEALEPRRRVRCGLYFPLLAGWRELEH